MLINVFARARVYSVLGRRESALYHAKLCLEICQENDIGDFDIAFARATSIKHQILITFQNLAYYPDMSKLNLSPR
jgi:hypothetical protein